MKICINFNQIRANLVTPIFFNTYYPNLNKIIRMQIKLIQIFIQYSDENFLCEESCQNSDKFLTELGNDFQKRILMCWHDSTVQNDIVLDTSTSIKFMK